MPHYQRQQPMGSADFLSSEGADADEEEGEERLQFLMSDPEADDDRDNEINSSPLPPQPTAGASATSASTSFASSSGVGISGRRQFGHSLVIQQQQQRSFVAGSAPAAPATRLSHHLSRHSAAGVATASALSQRAKSACLSPFGLAVAGDRRATLSDKWSQRRLHMMAGYTSVLVDKLHQPKATGATPSAELSFATPVFCHQQQPPPESLGTSGSAAAFSLVDRQLSSPSVRLCQNFNNASAYLDELNQDFSGDGADFVGVGFSTSSSSGYQHGARPSAMSALLRGTANVIASSSSSWRHRRRAQSPAAASPEAEAVNTATCSIHSPRPVELCQLNNTYNYDPASERSSAGSSKIVCSVGLARQQRGSAAATTPDLATSGTRETSAGPSGLPPADASSKTSPFDRQFRSYVKSAKGKPVAGRRCRPRQQRRAVSAGLLSCFNVHANDSGTVALERDINPTLLHRPYFTYWITLVHVLVFFGTLFTFGFAPVGVMVYSTREAEITTRNMLSAKVCAIDYFNLFIGPRMSDLIRVGAKYSLCMRRYDKLYRDILEPQLAAENQTGCCIHNDGSACFQSSAASCSKIMSTWIKWTPANPGPNGRISGAVCGQDPSTCLHPRSVFHQAWPDDITRWPPCLKAETPVMDGSSLNHLNCPISARPCCVGIKGECVMTTQHRCDFLRGTFFPERQLCSQVNCISNTCGMLGVADPERPAQFYRLFTSLFLHAGIVTLGVTLLHHLLFLRRLEQLAGWHRTAIIYIGSGFMGNLLSINFLPYVVDVGPTSAQVGSLTPILIEFGLSWRYVADRARAITIFVLTLGVLIGLGFFPWFDNFANLGGFASGCLLSVALLPYIHRGSTDESAYKCRLISVGVCLLLWLTICLIFLLVFYLAPVTSCSWCVYFNCAPKWFESRLTDRNFVDYCGNTDLNYLEPTRCIERLNTGSMAA